MDCRFYHFGGGNGHFFFYKYPNHPFYSKMMLTTTFADFSVERNTGEFNEEIEHHEYAL